MAKTYNTIYMDIRHRLKKAGVDAAQLEAIELVCFATDKSKQDLYKSMNLYASSETEQEIESIVQRRLKGEPLAYILGEWDFYDLTLHVDKSVLIPRPETELIAERAIELANASGEHGRVLDLCCGSGCVGLAVAKHSTNCRVVLADFSDDALLVARRNIVDNNLNGQITLFKANALDYPPSMIWDFNLIVCNPPYIPTADIQTLDVSVKNYEPVMALDGGEDGLDFYRSITTKWRKAMRSTCTVLFEVGYDQIDDVEKILENAGYINIKRHKDAFGIWRAIEASVM